MKTESKLLKYWNLATKIGIHEKIPKADVKHITLCNIIAFACIIQLLCFIPIFYTYWPETAGAFFSNLVLTLLYGLTLILNYRGYFLLARINIGITGLIGMSSNSIYSPQTPSQYAFLIAIFLHFFLYPPRQRYIMYIHALILGLLFIFSDLILALLNIIINHIFDTVELYHRIFITSYLHGQQEHGFPAGFKGKFINKNSAS